MKDLAPLHRSVLADPDDPALRQVWADALQERGDPLGEVVALQIAARDRALTPAQDKRLRSLVARHKNTWLGDLVDIVQTREGLVIDRGILVACQVQVKKVDALAAARANPLLGGLQSIWFSDRFAYDPRIADLLTSTVLARLREIVCVGANGVLPVLARAERALPVTAIWADNDAHRDHPSSIRDIEEAPGLAHLRHLGLTIANRESWVTELSLVPGLETLGITTQGDTKLWLERTRDLRNLRRVELRRHWIPIQGLARSHLCLGFTRDAAGGWSNLTVTSHGAFASSEALAAGLVSLGDDDLARIAVAPEDLDELAPALRRFRNAEVVTSALERSPFFPLYEAEQRRAADARRKNRAKLAR